MCFQGLLLNSGSVSLYLLLLLIQKKLQTDLQKHFF